MGQILIDIDAEQIAHLTIDLEGKVNVMNEEFISCMDMALEQLEARKAKGTLSGVIVTSAKRTFVAGGDLAYMAAVQPGMEAETFVYFERLKLSLRRLELLGVPVVAAINGSALGGGYELCLACHHRIALSREDAVLGLPEVDFGILPAAGGVIRLTALLGLERALPWLLQGRRVSLKAAKAEGLVDALVEDEAGLVAAAKSWIRENPTAAQPFEKRGLTLGAHMLALSQRQALQKAAAWTRRLGGTGNPATVRIADVAVQSLYLPWDAASRIETRGFVELLQSGNAQSRIRAFFNARRAS